MIRWYFVCSISIFFLLCINIIFCCKMDQIKYAWKRCFKPRSANYMFIQRRDGSICKTRSRDQLSKSITHAIRFPLKLSWKCLSNLKLMEWVGIERRKTEKRIWYIHGVQNFWNWISHSNIPTYTWNAIS